MKRLFTYLYLLGFLLISTGLMAQRPVPNYMEQAKLDARTNDHIEKQMEGQVVKHVYRGTGLGLWSVVFKSKQGKYYHIRIKRSDGTRLISHLSLHKPIKVKVTGDAKLLEEVLYLRPEYAKVQNELGITLTGLAHLQEVQSEQGSYKRDQSIGLAQKPKPEVFHEDVSIKKRKRTSNGGWAYILGNDDTILVRSEGNQLLKGRDKISYFSMTGVSHNGVYFKSPNTYYLLGGVPFAHNRTQRSARELLVGNAVILLDRDHFEVISNHTDSRGLLDGLKVKRGSDTLTLFFNAKKGQDISKAVENRKIFDAYYKTLTDRSAMLYAMKEGDETRYVDNSTEPFQDKNHYEENTVAFAGKITQAEFGRPDNGTDLKNFVIDDSVYVSVNQIVALNIQALIAVGKEITVEGWLRKKIPGEVNVKGYAILAASAITIDGKTFKQIYHDLKKTL